MFKQLSLVCGFSLLEVVIAVFVLTFGLLGICGLYVSSLQRTEDAYWRMLATTQWMIMVEQQNSYDYNCLDWSVKCEKMLPHGECKCELGKVTVCWRGKYNKQCVCS